MVNISCINFVQSVCACTCHEAIMTVVWFYNALRRSFAVSISIKWFFFVQATKLSITNKKVWETLFHCTDVSVQNVDVFMWIVMCIVYCWMITFFTHGPFPADLISSITMSRHYIAFPGVSTSQAAVLQTLNSVESLWAINLKRHVYLL